MDDGTARGWNGQLADIEYLDGAKVKAQISALETRLCALQQDNERLLGALQSILRRFDAADKGTLEIRAGVAWAMASDARAAIAEATPEGESR